MSELSDALATALSESRYEATAQDYDRWIWNLGPCKVQELLDVETVRSVDLDDGTVLELPAVYAGLLGAWRDHCKAQGWIDRAFVDDVKRLEADLLESFQAEADEEAGSGQNWGQAPPALASETEILESIDRDAQDPENV